MNVKGANQHKLIHRETVMSRVMSVMSDEQKQ